MPDLARPAAAAIALFAVCGYGPARLLLPAAWRAHLALFVLPIGAATSTLTLTVLGLAHVPLGVSLPLVLAGYAALGVAASRRRAERLPAPSLQSLVPLGLAALIAAIALLPSFRAGFATVQGQNGDAVLAVGTADLLAHAPPTANRPELALDRVPIQWRSKLPIYYGLAATAKLAHTDEIGAFSALAAVVVAMFALGIFLLAVHGLGAPPGAALLACFLVPLDRIVVHVAIHPYFNQLWALMALPFALLVGWRFLVAPDRRTAILAALFLALALFTYPLLLPFPAVFLAVVAWRRREGARAWAASVRAPRWAYAVAIVAAVPVAAVLVRGVVEKVVPAIDAVRPGGDLSGWSGMGVLPYLPFGRFFGVDGAPVAVGVLVAGILVAAVLGLRRSQRDIGVGLAVLLAGAIAAALYLLARGEGELFYFKDLAFAGPLVVLLAVVGLHGAPRVVAVAGLAVLTLVVADGARREVAVTFDQTPRDLLALRDWDRDVPAGQTIRIDVPPSGWQLWSWYLMPRHRVSASQPLAGFFPHPPGGLSADLALVMGPVRPPDAVGPPVRRNGAFALYRLRPNALPDTSSRALVFDITKITY